MEKQIGDKFVQALKALEEQGQIEPMKKLFSENCTLWNVQMKKPLQGLQGVEKFWQQYKSTFSEIHSQFNHRETSDHCEVLEWHSSGQMPSQEKVEYDGATILEHDGNQITAFRSYYDTRSVTHHLR